MQQQLDIEHRISREDHEVGGLLPLLIAGVYERHTGCTRPGGVSIDFDDLGIVAEREIRFADQNRQDRGLRACLGIVAATEPFAESAIGALPQTRSKRIGVRLRKISRRLRERLVAKLARSLGKQGLTERLLLSRSRIGS